MITVNLSWLGSPAEEQITGYMIYQDGAEYGPASSPSISIPNVTPAKSTSSCWCPKRPNSSVSLRLQSSWGNLDYVAAQRVPP